MSNSALSRDLRRRFVAVFAFLIAANLTVWVWAFYAFIGQPLMLGTAALAYSFGLRHAVDADHIAAIDNVTRKLMQEGQRPVGIGLWFSLGHSTLVVVAALVIGVTMTEATRVDWLKNVGGVISTCVSASFLFAIAAMNIVVLIALWKRHHEVRRGGTLDDYSLDVLLNGRGFLSRLLRPFFRVITQSWQMLLLGLLFGLGFETASEVGLLGISAAQSGRMSTWSILIFPALFTAGMSLIDTADGMLMLGAYNWALVEPTRKLYYNLIITAASVIVALLIGSIEGLRLISGELGLEGRFWHAIGTLDASSNVLGFGIVGAFILAWLISWSVYRYTQIARLTNRQDPLLPGAKGSLSAGGTAHWAELRLKAPPCSSVGTDTQEETAMPILSEGPRSGMPAR